MPFPAQRPPGTRSARPADDGGDPDVGALVRAASWGDDRAWGALIEIYARRVYALARSRCRNDSLAEEITQSVFVTVAAKLGSGQYAELGKFEPWLFRVAMNRIRDEMRRMKRHAVPTDPVTLTNLRLTTDETPLEPAPELEALRSALQHLTGPDREVVELRHHGGLSFQQIASILNQPMGTVLARHHRALKKLRTLIETNASNTEAD